MRMIFDLASFFIDMPYESLWKGCVRPFPGSGVEEETMNFVLKRRPDVSWSEKIDKTDDLFGDRQKNIATSKGA